MTKFSLKQKIIFLFTVLFLMLIIGGGTVYYQIAQVLEINEKLNESSILVRRILVSVIKTINHEFV